MGFVDIMKICTECGNNPMLQHLRMKQIIQEHERMINTRILEMQRIDEELDEIMKRINEAR